VVKSSEAIICRVPLQPDTATLTALGTRATPTAAVESRGDTASVVDQ